MGELNTGPQSVLSGMVSIRCTLGTPEIPKLVSLYRPLIVRCARGIELLSHLKDVIDDGMYTCNLVSMDRNLLNKLHKHVIIIGAPHVILKIYKVYPGL